MNFLSLPFIALQLLLLSAFCPLSNAWAQNLITNPTFTKGMTGWKLDYGSSNVTTDSVSSAPALHVTGATWASAYTDASALVKPGLTYTLSFEGRLSGPKVQGYVNVRMLDKNYQQLSAPNITVKSTSFATYSLQFTLPLTTKHLWIGAVKNSPVTTDYVAYDNFSLTLNPPLACGTNASGTTYQIPGTTTNKTGNATVAQCPYGGTVPLQTTTSQTATCLNGVQSLQGTPTSTTVNGTPTCNQPAMCGTHASGTMYTLTTSTTPGTVTPSVAQCPYGGTQATTTTVTQVYSCVNGAQTAVGAPAIAVATNGSATCLKPTVANGTCGVGVESSTGQVPDTQLCTAGTASAVEIINSSTFAWSCEGSGGGTTQQCQTSSFQKEFGERNGLGCYSQGEPGIVNAAQFYKWLGKTSDFVMDYDWSYNMPDTVARASLIPTCWKKAGFNKLAWALAPIDTDDKSTMADGVAGAYDQYYQQVAENLIKAGFPDAIIRLGWEFNGNWYIWSTTTPDGKANFVPLWQRIVKIMRAVPGAKFTFDWNYSMGAGQPDAFYPGDEYVDYIGADVYDRWWGTAATQTPDQRWQLLVNESGGLAWQANFAAAHHKQISFPEWGLGIGMSGSVGDDPVFMHNMYEWIQTHNVAYSVVWNENGDEMDIPNTQTPLSAAVYKADFGK